LDLLKTGKVFPKKIITHKFPLTEVKKAFKVMDEKEKHKAIKVILIP
jgi:threonine dehydrogenase-like Zn-dependent dehydrogenase